MLQNPKTLKKSFEEPPEDKMFHSKDAKRKKSKWHDKLDPDEDEEQEENG